MSVLISAEGSIISGDRFRFRKMDDVPLQDICVLTAERIMSSYELFVA